MTEPEQRTAWLDSRSEQRNFGIFYGWYVVAGAFFVTLIGFGSAYTFSAFVGALEHDFHASRGSVSSVFSLAGFLYFALGIVSGPLADRWGSRRLAVAGMLVVGAGLILAGFTQTLAGVYASYGLGIGLGVGLSYVPVLGAVQRWFVRRRGLASGLAVSGIGIGTLVLPPVASYLVSAIGWRHAYIALGVFAAIVGVGFALLIDNDPHERGLAPDGDPVDPNAHRVQARGVSIGAAIRSWRFIGLYVACLVGSLGLFVPFVHLVPYAQDHGVPASAAVVLLGVIGVGSTAGRFFLGGIADRLGRLSGVLAMFVGIGASMAIWMFASNFWTLGVFAFIFGIFYGGFVALLPALVMDDFGGKHVGGIIGVLYTSVAFGTLIGPSLAGFAFDISHSYRLPILASVIASLLAACMIAGTARARVPLHYVDAGE